MYPFQMDFGSLQKNQGVGQEAKKPRQDITTSPHHDSDSVVASLPQNCHRTSRIFSNHLESVESMEVAQKLLRLRSRSSSARSYARDTIDVVLSCRNEEMSHFLHRARAPCGQCMEGLDSSSQAMRLRQWKQKSQNG